jgi:hypothetical protein
VIQSIRDRPFAQRLLTIVSLAGLSLIAAAGILFWRPADATNNPYEERLASWTIEQSDLREAFVGYGIFTYRPDWSGPAQSFDGPALLRVDDADTPVTVRVDGAVSVARAAGGTTAELTAGSGQNATAQTAELTLSRGDTISLDPNTPFSVVTGGGQAVKFIAVVLTPSGPPSTPGIEQVEWRSWGESALPAAPFTVSVADVQLAGGERYTFESSQGPAMLAIEGITSGALSIGVTISQGAAVYQKMANFAPWELSTPVAYTASKSAFTNREKALEAGSGVFINPGSTVRIRNSSLVDGNAVRLIEIGAS